MERSYWSQILDLRISRRRSLSASVAGAAGAALLVACGGSDETERDSGGLVKQPVDTLKQAKRGGVLKERTFADPPTLDIYTANNPLNAVVSPTYSSLFQLKPGYMRPTQKEIAPDLVESWEWSPDGLQVTMKLRQGVRFHNKPPVNGRTFDVDDVLFTWDRFTRVSSNRASISNALNPQAPVISLTATDSRTVVLKLNEPIVHALVLFASERSQGIPFIPKETDTTFDIRKDIIATGPFMLGEYTPSVAFTLKRHPDYWDKDWALVEQIDLPIVPEYASALTHFKAGNFYSMGSYSATPGVTPEDVLPVVREEPRIGIYQGELRGTGSAMYFGWLPEGKSPFLDERVRQALSMAWDRDLFLDTFLNVSNFEAEGLPMVTRWSAHIGADAEGWWLDPKGKDFGPNAKYFNHDLSEGKKLLAAAGHPNGFEVVSNYITGPQLGVPRHKEVTDAFMSELGIRVTVNSIDYAKEYTPLYRDGKGQYVGWAYTSAVGGVGSDDPLVVLANEYWSKGGTPAFRGFSTSGKNDLAGDPQLDALIEKARLERDTEKRRGLAFDIQRYLAKAMYAIPSPGAASGFALAWPCLGNFMVQRGTRPYNQLWIDDTKAPLSNA
jgi:peptide/nickel transport system substrate-binding protein